MNGYRNIHESLGTAGESGRQSPWRRRRTMRRQGRPLHRAGQMQPLDGDAAPLEEEFPFIGPFIEVTRALATGERDPGKLTNAIFFARHPERAGRKIARGEEAAAKEWISIRDTMVLPALRRIAPGPTTTPGTPAASGGVAVRVVRRKPGWPASLEEGMAVRGLARFRRTAHPLDLVLSATAAAEGGYDTVNVYDRGIFSWGIMQWTVHKGSLQRALGFIKRRLGERGRAARWSQLFPDLDVREQRGGWQLLHRGVPVVGEAALRTLFRGSATRGRYDPQTVRRWATVFALAGRDPEIQELQNEYARGEVERVLSVDLRRKFGANYRRVGDYVRRSPKATVLMFGMWTNNPKRSYVELKRAIDRMAQRYGYDVARWPADAPSRFADEFERVLRASAFAWWGDAKAAAAKRRSRTQKLLDDYARATRQP